MTPTDTAAAAAALRSIDDLPGPRGWPILGNLAQIERARIHQSIEAWARAYGPYFRVRLGRRRALVVTDHQALATILRDRPDGFRRTRQLEVIGREMGLMPGVFSAQGDAWRRQRRMVMAGFDPTHVKAYFPSLLKVTQRLRRRWTPAAQTGRPIELQAELMRFTVDAIAGLAFGADVNTLESDDDVIQRHLDKIFPILFKRLFSAFPIWRYVKLPSDRALERSMVEVDAAIARFIAAARERLAADPARRAQPPNLLEAMLVAADEPDSGIADDVVAGNVLTMLLAGEDTTANSLAWMIYLLSRHPDALRRAEAEVRALGVACTDFTPEQMAALDYLEACAHETMRLKPVAPFQATEALHDTTIADIRVPAGTLVWCMMRGDSVSERHFPNALAFEPQRWLGGGNAASSAKRISMPFGGGPRICPGRYLALLEMKMAMAMLLMHFDIERVDTPDGRDAVEQMSFTMAPVGLTMRLRERA
ncbi:MAG: cytochrome P450 [Proteobacteria bacterium]|nr:cytochrome P450 [Pseudomonadota bacterium]